MPDGRLRRSNAWTLDGSETSAAPVSPDACIRLRSNAGGTALEVSYDQAAYVTLSGGSSKWNAITAPDGNLALSHVAYTTAFTWSATSGTASDLFTLQNTTDDIGTGAILAINTPGSSNAKDPLTITAQTNTRVQIRSNGDLLINRAVTTASGPLIDLRKSRNTLAAPWNVASGDLLGTIGYTAFCGTGGTGSEVQLGSFSLIADRDLTAADFGANFRWQTKDSTESFGLRTRMWLTTLGYLGIGQNLVVTDVGARLHVIESVTVVVAAIIQTAASSTADALRLNASSTTKVKFTTTSGGAMNSVFGSAALATNATDGFVYLPTCAGTPTGAATAYTGTSAFVLDTTNSKVYFYYSSAWHDLTGTGGANTALSNLASVSINASLIPRTTLDLGANTTAWRNLYIYGAGTYGSHSFKLHGTPTGHRVLSLPDVTDTVAVLGTSQTFTAPALIFGGTLAHTTANTATSSTQSFFDQNITIAPGGSSSAAYRMFDLSVLFTTAQTLSGSVVLYNSSTTHSQNSSLASYYVHFDTFTKDTANSVSVVTGYDWVASISSGTTSDLFGYIADFTVGASGTATTTIGFTSTLVNAGTATTYYAYRAIKSGTIANPYGFGSSAGFLHGFGTLTPTVVMDIVGGAADEVVKVTGDSINTAITGYAFGTGKAPIFKLVHGRNTAASPQTTESGDTLGSFVFYGQYDSTVGHIAGVATISAIAQAQFTASNAAPADLAFFTRPSSGSGNHQALLLTSDQRVGVGYDMAHSDVGARLHVLETDTAVVAAILRTAASSTADCLRLMASSTVKVKFTTNSGGDMNSVFGSAALATNATDGFIFAPTCAGAATGTPSTYTGTAPVVVDTTNFRIYVNIPGTGWKMAQLI